MATTFKIVISGSFRKFYQDITRKTEEFESAGAEVLSPKKSSIINPGAEFVVLATDTAGTPKEIEQIHLDAIFSADALYVVNPGGYCGETTVLEIGWALAFGKPVFFQAQCASQLIGGYGPVTTSAEEALEALKGMSQLQAVCRRTPLPLLQNYIHRAVEARGFADESPRDIMLLMLEEIGELAKAVRKTSGLKMDASKGGGDNLQEELADVLIYLLDLANNCHVDLASALLKKEAVNSTRVWKKT